MPYRTLLTGLQQTSTSWCKPEGVYPLGERAVSSVPFQDGIRSLQLDFGSFNL